MNEAEKERLIKKDLVSRENRVRHAFNQGYEMGLKENKKQSGDAISRQAVIELCEGWWLGHTKEDDFVTEVRALPSVTPQQRTGRWIQKEEEGEAEPFIIWECSECHCVDEDGKPSYKYCPQCGAKMEAKE